MDEVEVAVMLADVSGSTALYESVGNVEALDRVSACLDLLRDVIERNGGQVDFGKILQARNDVFGDSVNMAARLASVANSGEVLCSQDLYDQLTGEYRAMLRFFGPRHFKGKTALSNIYLFSEAVPGKATEIIFNDDTESERADAARLTNDGVRAALRFARETFICSAEKPILMGRSPDCDLVVPLPWVSRKHATIEIRGEQVYLTDSSTSGTYVAMEGQDPFVVRRESHLLHTGCTLSLARSHLDTGAQIVSCELLLPKADPE